METNRASGSQQPADNVDEDPSGVHEHTTPGRPATHSHDVDNGLTMNTSDNTDPGPSDPIITSQEYEEMEARLFQEPFTPEELLVAQNCVLPSSFNPEPSIRQIITQMAIYHKIRFQSCESAKLNSNINVPSTASASRPLDYAPDALGPATPFQLYHPAASPVGHQLAGSNIGNPNSTPRPSRLALGVPVGPPIVSQEKCDALAGRCNSLVWQPGAHRCLDHNYGRIAGKDCIRDIKARHALGIWCCTGCLKEEVEHKKTRCLNCRSYMLEWKKRKKAAASNDSGDGTQNQENGENDAEYPVEGASNSNSVNNGGAMMYPYGPGNHNPLGIGSSNTPITMPGIPEVQLASNLRYSPYAFQPSHTAGDSMNGSSLGPGINGVPSNLQNNFYGLLQSFGQISAPNLAQGLSDNASSSAGLPAQGHSSSLAERSQEQDQENNSHHRYGSQ